MNNEIESKKQDIARLYLEAKIRGYCSPYMRGQFANEGFDVGMLKLTEEVIPRAIPKKNNGKADFLLDESIGRC